MATKNSFQMFTKRKMPTVMMPGCARGSMILKKVLMGVQPSTAASSKVRERVAWIHMLARATAEMMLGR